MGRLDRVFVSTSRQTIELSWYSRDLLLAELRRRDSAAAIMAVFEAVDATRPITLGRADEVVLYEVIQEWSRRMSGELPVGVWDLRNAVPGRKVVRVDEELILRLLPEYRRSVARGQGSIASPAITWRIDTAAATRPAPSSKPVRRRNPSLGGFDPHAVGEPSPG